MQIKKVRFWNKTIINIMKHLTTDNIILIGAILSIFLFAFLIGFAIWFLFFSKYDKTKELIDKAIKDTNGFS